MSRAAVWGSQEVLLLLADVLVCTLAAYAALGFHARAAAARRTLPRLRLLGAAALAMGCGLWVSHLIAVTAFQGKVPVSINIGVTAFSAALAVAVSGVGFGLVLLQPRLASNGGAVVIGGAGGMHYIGMAALPMSGITAWDTTFVGASIAIGMLLGAVALATAMRSPAPRHRAIGVAFLAPAMLGLHFTAMAAATQVRMPIPLLGGKTLYAAIEHMPVAFGAERLGGPSESAATAAKRPAAAATLVAGRAI